MNHGREHCSSRLRTLFLFVTSLREVREVGSTQAVATGKVEPVWVGWSDRMAVKWGWCDFDGCDRSSLCPCPFNPLPPVSTFRFPKRGPRKASPSPISRRPPPARSSRGHPDNVQVKPWFRPAFSAAGAVALVRRAACLSVCIFT